MTGNIFGIDLGNSNVVTAGLGVSGEPEIIPNDRGESMTPSVVYFDETDRTIVGTQALHEGLADPDRFVTDAKRHLGTDKTYKIGRKTYRPKDIVQIHLEYAAASIEAHTGQRPRLVTVSVPANFADNKKKEVIEAAEAAGLEVIRMPHEPSAAILGCGSHLRGDGLRMVLDIGGSTVDISLAEVNGNNVQIITTNGLAEVGGQDFNARLRDWALDQFERQTGQRPDLAVEPLLRQDMYQRIEQAKITLSHKEQASIVLSHAGAVLNAKMARQQYRLMTQDLRSQIMDLAQATLREAQIKPDQLREIQLISGQSLDPGFADDTERIFGRKPWNQSNPLHAVALGDAIFARLERESQGHKVHIGGRALPPLSLATRDVTAHAIGVAVLSQDRSHLVNAVLLPKSSPIPFDRTERFRLADPGQTEAKIALLQGDAEANADDCLQLGHFDLTGAEAVHDRDHPIEVRLRLDVNGMLSASAYDPIGGATAEMEMELDYTTANGQEDK